MEESLSTPPPPRSLPSASSPSTDQGKRARVLVVEPWRGSSPSTEAAGMEDLSFRLGLASNPLLLASNCLLPTMRSGRWRWDKEEMAAASGSKWSAAPPSPGQMSSESRHQTEATNGTIKFSCIADQRKWKKENKSGESSVKEEQEVKTPGLSRESGDAV